MTSLAKIPVFSVEDYAYWKVRMRAFLQSMGADVWDITKNQAYEVLAIRVTPLQVTEYEANAKAVKCLVRWRVSYGVLTHPGFSGSPQDLDVP